MSDGGQYLTEIRCTGEVHSYGKSLRALLNYIENITAEIDIAIVDPEQKGTGLESIIAKDPVPAVGRKSPENNLDEEPVVKENHGLYLRNRDLRLLDVNFCPNEVHSIIVKRHAVLLSLDPFKAVVLADRVIVIIPSHKNGESNMDYILKMFEHRFREAHGGVKPQIKTIKTDDISQKTSTSSVTETSSLSDVIPLPLNPTNSFEYEIYEIIITVVLTLHSHEYEALNVDVHNFLALVFPKTAVNIPYVLQEKMRSLKDDVSRMVSKVGVFRRSLSLLLEDDEAMAFMNLTKFRADPSLYHTPLRPEILALHGDIEELLEAHLLDIDSLEAKLNYLLYILQNAIASVGLKLDVAQDKIMIANTTLMIAAVMIAFASYWTGVFGMSLDQTVTIQQTYGSFAVVFCSTLLIIIGGIPLVLYYYESTGVLPRVQRRRGDDQGGCSPGSRRGGDVMGMTTLMKRRY